MRRSAPAARRASPPRVCSPIGAQAGSEPRPGLSPGASHDVAGRAGAPAVGRWRPGADLHQMHEPDVAEAREPRIEPLCASHARIRLRDAKLGPATGQICSIRMNVTAKRPMEPDPGRVRASGARPGRETSLEPRFGVSISGTRPPEDPLRAPGRARPGLDRGELDDRSVRAFRADAEADASGEGRRHRDPPRLLRGAPHGEPDAAGESDRGIKPVATAGARPGCR